MKVGRVVQVKALAERLLAEHGLRDWSIENCPGWDDPGGVDQPGVKGECSQKNKTIYLNCALLASYPLDEQMETILHEIAHALAGNCGHALKWAVCAIRIGLDPMIVLADLSSVMYKTDPLYATDRQAAKVAFEKCAVALAPTLTSEGRQCVRTLRAGEWMPVK